MPVTRSAFARATRSSRSGGSSRSARYVTATYDRSSSASVSNAWIATEADVERYPKFDDLLEKWKGAIDTLHHLKGSDKLASLKNIEFDDEMSTIDRIQMACGRLGIDESVFDLHICITDDGKKVCCHTLSKYSMAHVFFDRSASALRAVMKELAYSLGHTVSKIKPRTWKDTRAATAIVVSSPSYSGSTGRSSRRNSNVLTAHLRKLY